VGGLRRNQALDLGRTRISQRGISERPPPHLRRTQYRAIEVGLGPAKIDQLSHFQIRQAGPSVNIFVHASLKRINNSPQMSRTIFASDATLYPTGLRVREVTPSTNCGKRAILKEATMARLILVLVLVCAGTVISTIATAQRRHHEAPTTHWYRAAVDPNAVFVGGTYAGSDPDPSIRAALIREFGRRR
jgi:hypothetical protein